MADWCILRTTPGSTIALAAALAGDGIEAWTPTIRASRDELRTREGQEPLPRGRGANVITVPLIPTFVFADYGQLGDLLRMVDAPTLNYRVWDKDERRMVVRGRPHFEVFRLGLVVPMVREWELARLREIEQDAAERAARRARPRKRGKRGRGDRQFAVGEHVVVPDGPFAGLAGVVVPTDKSGSVRVTFAGGAISAEIAPWLVELADIDSGKPLSGTAAIAA